VINPEVEITVETWLRGFPEDTVTPELRDFYRRLACEERERSTARDKASRAFLELRNRKASDEAQAPDNASVIEAQVIDKSRAPEEALSESNEIPVICEARTGATAQERRHPPKLAEFLLTLFATTRDAEGAIGDLNERFAKECKKFGPDRAVSLYWARTLRSLGPLLSRAIGKAIKWGGIIAAARRLF
jgi:hypothetical protein